jgi:hypothetical protein
MYPEDVYNCGLPLPFELLRPIAFQVAYEHINEKLRFPKYDGSRHHRLSCEKEVNEEGRPLHYIYMLWGSHNERFFSVIHVDLDESVDRENRRSYEYHYESGRVHIAFNCERGSQY